MTLFNKFSSEWKYARYIFYVAALLLIITLIMLGQPSLLNNSGFIAFYASVCGGALGFVGSYLAGIHGPERQSDLQRAERREKSKQLLLMQLRYSYELLSDPLVKVDFRDIIYIENWPEYLLDSDICTQEERNVVIKWFHTIKQISSGTFLWNNELQFAILCQEIKGTILEPEVIREVFKNYIPTIKSIIEDQKEC